MTHFTKMHGLGNDFMIIDATQHKINFDKQTIQQLANRHTGIGFDQMLLIEPCENADYFCRIYNNDGSEAEQCGNGLRCVARYLNEQGKCQATVTIATRAGIFPIKIKDMDNITVQFPAPESENAQVELETASSVITINTLSMGNPHAVMKVEMVTSAPVQTLGAEISNHSHFQCGTNVGFMEVVSRTHIRLRTFERGAGETHACGSNACAAAITGIRNGWLDSRVKVEFRYGSLVIEWEGEGKPVFMTGPASRVYEGSIELGSSE